MAKILYELEQPKDKITNFTLAEAVFTFCEQNSTLNAETVAKMILLQKEC